MTLLLAVNAGTALAQTTAFTYQGKLADNGTPASGNYDITFKLYDTATVGSGVQQGATLSLTSVAVSGGVFTVQLDFGACASCFTGAARYLEISVKPTSGSTFTTLSPRQQLTATPYALRSVNASTADGLSVTCVSCVTSSQIQSVQGSQITGNIAGNQINGEIPAASVPAGSTNYIQNSSTQQAGSANFYISGDGRLGGVLTAGVVNVAQYFSIGGNPFLRTDFGTGLSLGFGANTPFIGNNNISVGYHAGDGMNRGSNITLIGVNANAPPDSFTLSNATAIGARAFVSQSDSLVLGSINGVNGATANTRVGIGTTAPTFRLHVEEPGNLGLRVENNTSGGAVASFGGFGEFQIDAPGMVGGRFVVKEDSSVSIGNGKFVVTNLGSVGINRAAPAATLDVNGNIRFNSLGAAGGTALCLNSSSFISFCSSSRRYKENIVDFASGLSLLHRLRPVTFDWKESKRHDLGLVAEEVAEVEPLLVTHNDKGEIEGVKYDRLSVVLVNAIKEQQAQIERQQAEITLQHKIITQQQQELADLKKLVSGFHPKARRRK